jgi:polyisoprenyl-teichoic acid--peptidoglycan teichoic acid transferase
MKNSFPGYLKQISPGQRILFGIAIALAIPAFIIARNLVVCWSITDLPGDPPASCGLDSRLTGPRVTNVQQESPTAVPQETEEEIAAPEVSLPAWDGGSRVTLLFIGLDERDWEAGQGAPRSDTMILFTIDPISKTAGMLSIPRDMWVNIPGFGFSRINTAYSLGEARKLPGGGPGLAIKTVEHFIGVPIHYYAQVDFNAFEEAIDAMGGLFLCPRERITIDPIGPKPPVKIGPECRNYWGYEVLGYARNRKTAGGDIDRANRQQKVVMALVDQVFSPQNFPTMAARAPDIYLEARSGLRTNLGFDNALKLGALLSTIPPENIKHGVIDYSMLSFGSVIMRDGQRASVLKPYPDKIRLLRDEIFSAAGPVSPIASGAPDELMQADAARVRVVNGTNIDGLSEQIGSYLSEQGMLVLESDGSADRRYDRTVIVVYGPKLYTLRYLVTVLGVESRRQISFSPDTDSSVDIEVRVGTDAQDIIH